MQALCLEWMINVKIAVSTETTMGALMANRRAYKIAVFDGDGIGPEIMAPAIEVLDAVLAKLPGVEVQYTHLPAGAQHFAKTGDALPKASVEVARASDAVLLSAMGLPHIRKADGTEITPQIELRFILGLYAGVRPVKIFPGQKNPLSDPRAGNIDFVLIRESTEGMFAFMNEGKIIDNDYATETLKITRAGSERLFDFAFRLAQRRARVRKLKNEGRAGHVTCVDKANVFRAFWFFRTIFEETAKKFPEIGATSSYVDAFAMQMIQRPWDFDVVVTENMFGDILSDLGAGLMGSLGLAPSADIGDEHAVFQPCHGTAPDIAGKGIANPSAMFLSAAMMLDWLALKHGDCRLTEGALMIENAVGEILRRGGDALTRDMGGKANTRTFTDSVLALIN